MSARYVTRTYEGLVCQCSIPPELEFGQHAFLAPIRERERSLDGVSKRPHQQLSKNYKTVANALFDAAIGKPKHAALIATHTSSTRELFQELTLFVSEAKHLDLKTLLICAKKIHPRNDHLSKPARLRKGLAWVDGSNIHNAVYIPPPPDLLANLIEKAIEARARLSKSAPILASSLWIPIMALIHPMADGNGRLGRVLFLGQWKRLGLDEIFAYATLLRIQRNYGKPMVAQFRRIIATGNYQSWFEFVAECAHYAVETCSDLIYNQDHLIPDQMRSLLARLEIQLLFTERTAG